MPEQDGLELDLAAGTLARKPKKLVAVALANKVARIIWAMMARGEAYRHQPITALNPTLVPRVQEREKKMVIGRSDERQSGLTRCHERPQLCSISLAEPIWAGGHDAASREAGHMTAIERRQVSISHLEPCGPSTQGKWLAGATAESLA